ncbi:coproporphyrinogen III oxidase [Collimonas arenae]|nr:coproporphyrinogen III oxidase [Collimonas arenae]
MNKSILSSMEEYGTGYVMYPAMKCFSTRFGVDDFLEAATHRRNIGPRYGLSLSLHMPPAASNFQPCPGFASQYRDCLDIYLAYLKREIGMLSALFSDMDPIEQLCVTVPASTCLSMDQCEGLMRQLRDSFNLAAGVSREYVFKIGVHAVSVAHVHALHVQGFNRLHLIAEDCTLDTAAEMLHDKKRIQPAAKTVELIKAAQVAGFRSVGVDFIYGCPGQNIMSVARNLSAVIAAAPDSVVLHGHIYLPLASGDMQLSDMDSRLAMFHRCVRQLNAAGYAYIGMNHFAKPEDEIAVAQRQGRLYRNLQGFSIHPESDAIGCGVAAIAAIGNSYSQNQTNLSAYYANIDAGLLPVGCGTHLTMDDLLRRFIIERLACNFELSLDFMEIAYPIIVFKEYFSEELAILRHMETDGLIRIDSERITVPPRGRLLIHVICKVFDRYQGALSDWQSHPRNSLA